MAKKRILIQILLVLLISFFFKGFSVGDIPDVERILIKIPPKDGFIWDKSLTKEQDNPVVFIVQDSHCNYEAQKSIAALIRYLCRNTPSMIVFPEGGFGDYDLAFFKTAPEGTVWRNVCDKMLRDGLLCASEYCAITSKDMDITLFGPEDVNAYQENLELFRHIVSTRDEYLPILDDLILKARNKLYEKATKKQTDFIALWNKRMYGGTRPYINAVQLYEMMPQKGYPYIERAKKYLKLEKIINFKALARESEWIVDHLGEKLSDAEIDALTRFNLDYQTGAVTVNEYFAFLNTMIDDTGLDVSSFPEMKKYRNLMSIRRGIPDKGLHDEMVRLESHVSERLFKGRIKKDFVRYRDLILYERMIELKIHPEMLALIIDKDPEIENNELGALIQKAKDFYYIVFERNIILARNIINQLNKEKTQYGTFVVGGFHSDEVAGLLKEKGSDYAVICPRFSSDERSVADDTYENRMLAGYNQMQAENLTSPPQSPEKRQETIESFRIVYLMQLVAGAERAGIPVDQYIDEWKTNLEEAGEDTSLIDEIIGTDETAITAQKAYEIVNIIDADETNLPGNIEVELGVFDIEYYAGLWSRELDVDATAEDKVAERERALSEARDFVEGLIERLENDFEKKTSIVYGAILENAEKINNTIDKILVKDKDLAERLKSILAKYRERASEKGISKTSENTVLIVRQDFDQDQLPDKNIPRLILEYEQNKYPQIDAARAIAYGLIAIGGVKGLDQPGKEDLKLAIRNLYKNLPQEVLDEAKIKELLTNPEFIIPAIDRRLFRKLDNRIRSIREMKVWA